MLRWPETIGVLSRSLEAASLRHHVLAHNLANAATPGYQRAGVSFEAELRQALRTGTAVSGVRTHPLHRPVGGAPRLAAVAPRVVRDRTGAVRGDGSGVDIEAEMAMLMANEVRLGAVARSLNDQIARLRMAIGERG